jgi:hypothetical protein
MNASENIFAVNSTTRNFRKNIDTSIGHSLQKKEKAGRDTSPASLLSREQTSHPGRVRPHIYSQSYSERI